MQSITGWIVQTARGTHGPFANAGEAGIYIETHHQSLAAPFVLLPMHAPLAKRSRSIMDTLRTQGVFDAVDVARFRPAPDSY